MVDGEESQEEWERGEQRPLKRLQVQVVKKELQIEGRSGHRLRSWDEAPRNRRDCRAFNDIQRNKESRTFAQMPRGHENTSKERLRQKAILSSLGYVSPTGSLAQSPPFCTFRTHIPKLRRAAPAKLYLAARSALLFSGKRSLILTNVRREYVRCYRWIQALTC